MKHTRHLCDFCGCTMSAGDNHATLTVPLTQEESQLKQRVEPKDEILLFGSLYFGSATAPTGSANYDMCRSCVGGLLRARMATNKQLREALGVMMEESQ